MIGAMRRFLQPSLVRRLVLAQIVVSALLWVALAALVARDISIDSRESDLEQMRFGAELVLPLAQALPDRLDLLKDVMQRVDKFQLRSVESADLPPGNLARLYLWRDGQLIYSSKDADASILFNRSGVMNEVMIKGLPWRAFAKDSPDGRTRFAALSPGSLDAAGITPWSRSWLVLPLLVSMPLLVIPAWLSVRYALRPWQQLTTEVASRNANDLSPLNFVPRHKELMPLSDAVDQLLTRLRDVRERERTFIADAAHELRTPIAAMQVNAEALKVRAGLDDDNELLQGLLRSNTRAGHLVSQLLALSRSETVANRQSSSEVDIAATAQDAMAQLHSLAHAGGVDLELESEPGLVVYGDAESLGILVENLIGNAIKFSPEGATVRVHVRQEHGQVLLTVLDEGPGIAPELRKRVFDRFYRVPGQLNGGSGLGLAIAKSVADHHGASLELADGPEGQGLEVRLRIAARALALSGSLGQAH